MPILLPDSNVSTALSIVDFGEEMCRPGHTYGPAMRAYYLFHYVASGKGELSAGGQRWPVGEGEAFLIYPGEITTYRADMQHPWHYAWVGFSGEQAEDMIYQMGFSRTRRVARASFSGEAWQALHQMRQDAARLRLGHLAALGSLYRFFALMAPAPNEGDTPHHARHYEKAIWYMQGAYARNVSVQEIADFVGLSRSQLFRVFEKNCGQSPKAVLQGMRLHQALMLLEQSSLPVEQVALSVGFRNGGQFSAAFRGKYGISPQQRRRMARSLE